MPNITTTIQFVDAQDLGGPVLWANPTNTAASDDVFGSVDLGPSAFSNLLNPLAPASEFTGLGGRIPVSLTWTMRINTDDPTRSQTLQMSGEEVWFTGVQIGSFFPGDTQTFPIFTPFTGTTAQKRAVLQNWVDNGFGGTTTLAIQNNLLGLSATVQIDWMTFDLVTSVAVTRNRRRSVAARRLGASAGGKSCH